MKMKIYTRIIKLSEPILVIFVWMVLIITPILFRDDFNNSVWRSVRNQIEILALLSLLFLLTGLFSSQNCFSEEGGYFIFQRFSTIALLTIGSFIYDTTIRKVPPRGLQSGNMEEQRLPPPGRSQEFDESMKDPRRPQPRQPRPMPPFANFLIMSVLIVGFDTGLRSGLRLIESENEKVQA